MEASCRIRKGNGVMALSLLDGPEAVYLCDLAPSPTSSPPVAPAPAVEKLACVCVTLAVTCLPGEPHSSFLRLNSDLSSFHALDRIAGLVFPGAGAGGGYVWRLFMHHAAAPSLLPSCSSWSTAGVAPVFVPKHTCPS